MNEEIRVEKRCPVCGQRLFDTITLASGSVEIKCPRCKQVVLVNLELRMSRRRSLQPWYLGMYSRC